MPQPNDLSRSLVALDQNSTIIAVIEMSQSSWLVGGMLPGIERQPRKKLEPSPERLLAVLHRWRDEAARAGRTITRIALAFEAGRDGFWLARWLAARGVEAHVIHLSSVAVSREHRRAKTDRLDTELLKRGFLGWLRGERGHCSMARVPTIAEEDAKRPNREFEEGERALSAWLDATRDPETTPGPSIFEALEDASKRLVEDRKTGRDKILQDIPLQRIPAETARSGLELLGWADGAFYHAWRLAESLRIASGKQPAG